RTWQTRIDSNYLSMARTADCSGDFRFLRLVEVPLHKAVNDVHRRQEDQKADEFIDQRKKVAHVYSSPVSWQDVSSSGNLTPSASISCISIDSCSSSSTSMSLFTSGSSVESGVLSRIGSAGVSASPFSLALANARRAAAFSAWVRRGNRRARHFVQKQ